MSQVELAKQIGLDRVQTVNDWIQGRQTPKAAHLRALRPVLQMSVDELLGIADGQEPPFEAWSKLKHELAIENDALTHDEARALKSILWPPGREPTVHGYRLQLAALRGGTRVRAS